MASLTKVEDSSVKPNPPGFSELPVENMEGDETENQRNSLLLYVVAGVIVCVGGAYVIRKHWFAPTSPDENGSLKNTRDRKMPTVAVDNEQEHALEEPGETISNMPSVADGHESDDTGFSGGDWDDIPSDSSDSVDMIEALNAKLIASTKLEKSYGAATPQPKNPYDLKNHYSQNIRSLLRKQSCYCQNILGELNREGRKTGHWIWWIFPTDLPGKSEPPPKTFVLPSERHDFLRLSEETDWQTCLEVIAALVDEKGMDVVLPREDRGRVHFFCKFWTEIVDDLPTWLRHVLGILSKCGQLKCKFNTTCTKPICTYLHDTEDGASPAVQSKRCRFNVDCTRPDCKFEHDTVNGKSPATR